MGYCMCDTQIKESKEVRLKNNEKDMALFERKNEELYKFALDYLKTIAPKNVEIEKYFHGDNKDFKTLDDIFVRFIESAQNYQRMPNVIKFQDRKDEISEILYGFDHKVVSGMGPGFLYQFFRYRFDATSPYSENSCWYKWSCAIVDSAKFLNEFKDADDFVSFVNTFNLNNYTRMALPLLISEKIRGIGFALACDLLKELGFTQYPKPDVHMIEVFSELGLSENNALSTFEAIVRMADICKKKDESVTPYKVDKIIWLICSGRFYLEKPEEIKIDSYKKDFINKAKEKFKSI